MKHILQIIGWCFILNTIVLKAQTYTPFPLTNASWCVSSGSTDGTNLYTYNHYYQYTGITQSFNNVDYYQLKDTIQEIIQPMWGGNWGFFYFTRYFYLRQDTAQKKAFLYDVNSNTELTAFNFNLNIGDLLDTSKVYCPFPPLDSLFITSIDSVLLNGMYHRRYNFQPLNCQGFYPSDTSLVEGVGMLCGLFTWPSCFEYYSILNQHAQNGQIIYPSGGSGFCAFTGVENLIPEQSFQIFPAEQLNNFILNTPVNWRGVANIISVDGKAINEISINQARTEINLNNFSNGLYFISLFEKQRVIKSFKVVLH